MEVSKDEQLSLLYEVVDHLLGVVDRGVQHFRRGFPSSIQIAPGQRATIVSINDTVWVQHRDDFENKVLSKNLGFWNVRAREKVQCSLHHPGPDRLTRVDSGRQDHTFALGHILRVLLARDCEELKRVSCQRLAECLASRELRLDWVSHDLADILGQVREGVRVAVCKVDRIVFVLEVEGERVGVVRAEDAARRLLVVLADAVLVVANLGASPMPADVSMGSHLLRVDKDFHSLVVETVGLAEVQHVESHLNRLVVRRPKEIPLGVPTCVHIVL